MSTGRLDSEASADGARLLRAVEAWLDAAVNPRATRDALVEAIALAGGAVSGARELPWLRTALAEQVFALLQGGDGAARLAATSSRNVLLDWTEALLRLDGEVTRHERVALDELRSGQLSSDLALDVEAYAEASLEALQSAQRLVRVSAVARRALRDLDDGRRAARSLLALPLGAFEDVVLEGQGPSARETTADGPLPSQRDLTMRAEAVLAIARALFGLATVDSVSEAVAGVRAIAEQFGERCILALADSESGLVLHGANDLDGTVMELANGDLLAARALLTGACERRSIGADTPVIESQVARRLGAKSLCAIPMFAPDTVGVLYVAVSDAHFALQALAALAAPALRQPLRLRRLLDEADRSVRSRYEQRLREVVHEANNPLSVIHNYLHVLGSRLDEASEDREQLRLIGDEIRRTSDILRALVDAPAVTSVPDVSAAVASLNERVRDAVGLLEPALMREAGIELCLDLDEADVVPGPDDGRLRQILLNLLKNAVEAMADCGRIELGTRTSILLPAGPGFEITIADSGPGIEPELLEGLFAADTSTKGGGRGLGLGIVRQLVEELDGTVSIQSRIGHGTAFRLQFPRA